MTYLCVSFTAFKIDFFRKPAELDLSFLFLTMKLTSATTDLKSRSITCSACEKTFSARNEATCKRFFKLHVKKSHPNADVCFEDVPRNIKEEDAQLIKQKGMDIRQVKVRLV